MEPMIGSLPGFVAFEYLRPGFEMRFSGNAPDERGEPEGEHVEVTLTVPPLNFYYLQKVQAIQKARAAPATADELNSDIIDSVFLALKRNYRGVPRWLVEQSLDGPMLVRLGAKMREMTGSAEQEKKETGTVS
jgi:hypothetical protein